MIMASTEAQRIHEFLHGIQLDQFYRRIVDKLHVTRLNHFAHVTEQDLDGLGMSKPEQRRLFEALKKSKKKPLFGSFRRKKSKTKLFSSEPEEPQPTPPLTGTPPSNSTSLTCVIDEKDLILHQMLGTGAFGYVRKAEWITDKSKKVDVAVKCLKISKDSAFVQLQLDFAKEANGMIRLDHPHIIKLYGVVLSTPIMLVTELAALGCLLTCLREENPKFLISQLCDFVIQVASGMSYLESQHYIHRDLAARNILLSSYEEIKIGDFGLMRPLGTEEDYYTMNPKGKVPFAWCPPESLKFRKFSHASDMWSFGILLMELFSYGEEPWPGLNCTQILRKVDLPNLERPQKPSHCPSKVYNVVYNHCWAHEPAHRPTFPAMQNIMEQIRPQDVKAKRTFDSQTPQNLFFVEGDAITLIEASPDASWWRGQNKRTGRVGMFPSDSVNSSTGSSSPNIIRSASFAKNVESPKSPSISCTPEKPDCDCGVNHLYDLPFIVSSPKATSPTRSLDNDLTLSTESGYSSSFSCRSTSESSRSQAYYENFTGSPNYELMEPKVRTKPTRPPPTPDDDCKDVRPASLEVNQPSKVEQQQQQQQDSPDQPEQVTKRWSSGDKPISTRPFTLSRRVGAKKLKSFNIPVKKSDDIPSNAISNSDVQSSSSPRKHPTSEDSQKTIVPPPRRFTRSCSSDGFRSKSLKEAQQQVKSKTPTEMRLLDEVKRSSSFTSSTRRGQERKASYENHEFIPRSKSVSVGYDSQRLRRTQQQVPFYENHEIINTFKTISSRGCNINEKMDLERQLSPALQSSPGTTVPSGYEKMDFQQNNIENERNFTVESSCKNAHYENLPVEPLENFVMIEHSDVPDEINTTLSNLKCPSYENQGFEELTAQSKTALDKEFNTCDPFVCEELSCSLPNTGNWEICKESLVKSGGSVVKIGRSITPRIRKTSSDGDLNNDESYINVNNSDYDPSDSSQFKDKPKEKVSVDVKGELASIVSSRMNNKESVAITDNGVTLVGTRDEIARGTPPKELLSSLQDRDQISSQMNTESVVREADGIPPPLPERKRHSLSRITQGESKNVSYENVRKSGEISPIPVHRFSHESLKDKKHEEILMFSTRPNEETFPTRPNVLSFENKLAAFTQPLSQPAQSLLRKDHIEEDDAPALPPKERLTLRSPGRPTTSNYPRLSRDSSDVKLTFQDNVQRYRPCPTKGSPNYEYPLRDAKEGDDLPPPLPKKTSKSSIGEMTDMI